MHEGVHARLMLLLAASGQQAAALSLYAELRTRLDEELGVEPGHDLADAHLRVLRHEVTAAAPAAEPGDAIVAASPRSCRRRCGRSRAGPTPWPSWTRR